MHNIRILHLSTGDFLGGAARAAYRIHKAVAEEGVHSTMMVRHKITNDPSVIVSSEPKSRNIATNILRVFGSKLQSFLYKKRKKKKFSSMLFYYSGLPYKFLNEFDVICLYWVCDGLLSPETLTGVTKPIIWRLSDMWPFTGGCHYSEGCDRYIRKCGKCPALGSYYSQDVSNWLWKRKYNIFKNLDITVVAPSRWIGKCARNSSLFRNKRIEIIPTGINTDIYTPQIQLSARNRLNLPRDKKLILFGSINDIANERKGYKYIREVIAKLNNNDKNIELMVFGNTTIDKELSKDIFIHFLGRIDDESLLASVYAAADVFIAPSVEENLPNTVIEAMGCGIACVAFHIGGMPDLIEHRKTGYLAIPYDSDDMIRGIEWLLEDENRRQLISYNAYKKIKMYYSIKHSTQCYIQLYKNLLNI